MPIKLVTPFLISIMAVMFIPGCHTPKANSGADSGDEKTMSPSRSEKVLLAIPAQDGTSTQLENYSIEVPTGGSAEITLPFQAGTGYSWALASHSDGLALVNTSTRSLTNDGRTGGPMESIYVLKRSQANTTPETAVFKLSRPWESDAPAAREVKITFTKTDAKG